MALFDTSYLPVLCARLGGELHERDRPRELAERTRRYALFPRTRFVEAPQLVLCGMRGGPEGAVVGGSGEEHRALRVGVDLCLCGRGGHIVKGADT